MKIKKTRDFVEGAGIYEISFENDERIKEGIKRYASDEDSFYASSFGEFDSYFCEIYRRIYNRTTGGAYVNGPRLLAYSNRGIFKGDEFNDAVGVIVLYETIKQFHEIGWYKPVIGFVVSTVAKFEHVNCDDIKNLLEVFEIAEGYSLAQFCQNAYEVYLNEYESDSIAYERMLAEEDGDNLSSSEDEIVIIPDDFDIYHCKGEYRSKGLVLDTILGYVEKPSAENGLLSSWMKPLVECESEIKADSLDDIDQLINWLTELAYQEAFRAKIREDHLVFLADDNDDIVLTAQNIVSRYIGDRDSFKYKRKCLGVLRELDHADIDIRIDKSLEILSSLSEDEFTETVDLLLGYIERYLAQLIGKSFSWLFDEKEDSYNIDFVFTELEKDDTFLEACKKAFEKWESNGLTIVSFIPKITEILDRMNPEEGITLELNSIIKAGLIALYASKEYGQATEYILKYNKHISRISYAGRYANWISYHVWNIIMARCFYHVEDPEKANILLGLINEYSAECEIYFDELKVDVENAINHIDEEKRYLHSISPILEYYGDADSIEKVIYSDGGIETTVNEIKTAMLTNKRIDPNLYMDLFRYACLLEIDEYRDAYRIIKWKKNERHCYIEPYEAIEDKITLSDIFFSDTKTYVNFCEMYDQQKKFSKNSTDRQLLVSGDLLTGIKTAKILSIKRINLLQDQVIEETISQISELRTTLLSNGATEEEIIAAIEDIVEDLSDRVVVKDSKWERVEKSIRIMEVEFFDGFGISIDGSIIEKLGAKAESLLNYLITSERVFIYLSKTGSNEKADFSAALISMTKALELVLNTIFKKAVAINGGNDEVLKIIRKKAYKEMSNYIDEKGLLKESLELWAAINLIKNGKLFNGLLVNELIDCNKLSSFKDHSITVGNGRKELIISGEKSSNKNRSTLCEGMHYVRKNYRNKTAHPEPVEESDAENCRKLLIQGEGIIWILLYIMK